MAAREAWALGAGLLLALYCAGLCVTATMPMTPVDLFWYGVAFAGGVLILGAGLLLLFAAWLWLLGSRPQG